MKLSDVVGNAGLAGYAVVAMILFLVAFVAVVVWVFAPSRRRGLERQGRLPLEEGEPESRPEENER